MWHFFRPTGRLHRRAYFWRVPALYVLAFVFYGLPVLAEIQFGNTAPYWRSIALAGMVLCCYLVIIQLIKRTT